MACPFLTGYVSELRAQIGFNGSFYCAAQDRLAELEVLVAMEWHEDSEAFLRTRIFQGVQLAVRSWLHTLSLIILSAEISSQFSEEPLFISPKKATSKHLATVQREVEKFRDTLSVRGVILKLKQDTTGIGRETGRRLLLSVDQSEPLQEALDLAVKGDPNVVQIGKKIAEFFARIGVAIDGRLNFAATLLNEV